MSGQGLMMAAAAALAAAASPAIASAAPPTIITATPPPARIDPLAALAAMTARRTRATCVAEAMQTSDIVVCAPREDQALPVPEVYGPVAASTDGAAIDPSGAPCGAGISNNCWGGGDVLAAIDGVIGLVGLLIDPGKNLGEGDPIPERFRGANR